MTGQTTRKRLTETTRRRLIDAAAELISEEGYERAGVLAIARRAGLTNGAIYGNFKDKAHLLAAAIEMRLPRFFTAVERGRREDVVPAQVLGLVARSAALDTPEADRRLLIEAWSAAWRDPAVRDLVLDRLERIESVVTALGVQAQEQGDLAEDLDPATLARFGMAIALGYHLIHTAGAPDPDRRSWLHLVDRVLSSLHTRPAGGSGPH